MLDYDKSTCIEDFCGTAKFGFPVSYWADYFPDLLTTYFGGDWSDIPPLHTDITPTEEIFTRWVNFHQSMTQENTMDKLKMNEFGWVFVTWIEGGYLQKRVFDTMSAAKKFQRLLKKKGLL